jgi:ubiquinone/menaquinone biosynthesis C-methylase UbiE
MREINLLSSLPRTKRNIASRGSVKSDHTIDVARKFGVLYFDGPREYGYGGYKYDGRWRTVAKALIEEYGLKSGMKVLDVGCAKGFLVKDLMIECPGLEVFGIDISSYALLQSEVEVVGRLHLGSAVSLPFPEDAFDLVLSINTIHNLNREAAKTALQEIQRVSRSNSYIVVDSYLTIQQKQLFEQWVLTARFHDYPDGWIKLFEESGYTGDYSWTIIE